MSEVCRDAERQTAPGFWLVTALGLSIVAIAGAVIALILDALRWQTDWERKVAEKPIVRRIAGADRSIPVFTDLIAQSLGSSGEIDLQSAVTNTGQREAVLSQVEFEVVGRDDRRSFQLTASPIGNYATVVPVSLPAEDFAIGETVAIRLEEPITVSVGQSLVLEISLDQPPTTEYCGHVSLVYDGGKKVRIEWVHLGRALNWREGSAPATQP